MDESGAGASVAGQRPEDGGVQRLRAVRDERHLVRPRSDGRGNRLAGRVEQ
jgi:hypothetical protein